MLTNSGESPADLSPVTLEGARRARFAVEYTESIVDGHKEAFCPQTVEFAGIDKIGRKVSDLAELEIEMTQPAVFQPFLIGMIVEAGLPLDIAVALSSLG